MVVNKAIKEEKQQGDFTGEFPVKSDGTMLHVMHEGKKVLFTGDAREGEVIYGTYSINTNIVTPSMIMTPAKKYRQ